MNLRATMNSTQSSLHLSLPKARPTFALLRLSLLLATSLIFGCASTGFPPPDDSQPPPVQDNSTTTEQPEPRTPAAPEPTAPANTASSSAALLLLAQSETLREKGELPKAVALVERAIRLEPSRGDLWVQLGRLGFDSGNLGRAEQYARKGISLAGDSHETSRLGWLLLADVSEARGDLQGAAQLRARWLNSRG